MAPSIEQSGLPETFGADLADALLASEEADFQLSNLGQQLLDLAPQDLSDYLDLLWREKGNTPGFFMLTQLATLAKQGMPHKDDLSFQELDQMGFPNAGAAMISFRELADAWKGVIDVQCELNNEAKRLTIRLYLVVSADGQQVDAAGSTLHGILGSPEEGLGSEVMAVLENEPDGARMPPVIPESGPVDALP